MKTPVFLLGLAVLFWGWQTGLWIFAIPIALIIEYSNFTDTRWDLGDEEFKRASNLSLILLVVLAIYLGIATQSIYFIYKLIQWLPFILFPLVAAQIYSVSDRFNIRTLFLLLNNLTSSPNLPSWHVNLTYPYLALCLLSASAADSPNISFYLGSVILGGFVFWHWRSPRFSPLIWAVVLLLAGSLGFVGHIALHNLHLTLEKTIYQFISDSYVVDSDPYQKTTSMGDIGTLKLSNEIIFRVAAEPGKTPPSLLRESTYNKYFSSIWVAVNSEFNPIKSETENKNWLLTTNPLSRGYPQITIYDNLERGKGLLKLADGTFQVNELPVLTVEKNQYGTVKIEGKPGLISYKLQFAPGVEADIPPTEADLEIPETEKETVEKIVRELELEGKSPEAKLQQIFAFFQNNFDYSLELLAADAEKTALSTFLETNRVGHCEYFASAATLLLRAAGIPARYAVGFSIHEYSPLEQKYVVRARNAHAWTLAYINGDWVNFDTTPESWINIEDEAAPQLGFIRDSWSWVTFQFFQLLGQIQQSQLLKYWWWLAIPFVLLSLRQLSPKRKIRRVKSKGKRERAIAPGISPGNDSEFYLIEQVLSESGFNRRPSESLKEWLDRLTENLPNNLSDPNLIKELPKIIDLHYRYRFDPRGISSMERNLLKSSIKSWLKRYNDPC
jgi:hypothetical protein